ncbi:MAG: ribonuclease PH [Leptospiraceae bacterium]|nr:ribonuclease PH [Leptospiraceae bacterium]
MSRANHQMRSFRLEAFPSNAPGSVLVHCGETKVLCTASYSTRLPGWMKDQAPEEARGWVTAEYAMLPGSTLDRKKRGSDGRSSEIQRLIARVLRGAVDLKGISGLMVHCDCDVIKADGGTRTTAISGAWVALVMALQAAAQAGDSGDLSAAIPYQVAAVSAGIVDGQQYLDLDYNLDSRAQVDLNVAANSRPSYIEIQGTGEAGDCSRSELNDLLDLADQGIQQIFAIQRDFLQSMHIDWQ